MLIQHYHANNRGLCAPAGEGAFAIVEKCIYTPASGDVRAPQTVAVKRLRPEVMENQTDVDAFLKEVRTHTWRE